MRNVAVNGSNSDFVFLNDLDFIPMVHTEDIFNKFTPVIKPKQVHM